jgi:hypothetical protein
MAWLVTEPFIVEQSIDETSDTAKHPLGTIVRAKDETYGSGEFIYLKGVVNTVAGLMVGYNPVAGTTTLTPNTAGQGSPVAVAMAATVANKFGWYQIGGAAVIKKTATIVNANVAIYQSGTAGRVMATAASGKQVLGARSINTASVVSATSTVNVLINRPHLQGQVA